MREEHLVTRHDRLGFWTGSGFLCPLSAKKAHCPPLLLLVDPGPRQWDPLVPYPPISCASSTTQVPLQSTGVRTYDQQVQRQPRTASAMTATQRPRWDYYQSVCSRVPPMPRIAGLGHHLFTCAFGVNKRLQLGITPMHIFPSSTIAALPRSAGAVGRRSSDADAYARVYRT